HPNVGQCLAGLAVVRQALGKKAEARDGFDEALAILRRNAPKGSPLLATTLRQSGDARLENKDAAGALPELQEAVALGERLLPAAHPQLKEFRESLAKCRAALAK